MKSVLSSIPTFYILAIRFCGAALILLPAGVRKLKSLNKTYFLGGSLMGVALLLGYVFQTFGLQFTTPGKNAFLTSVYCVIVPFLYWGLVKRKPDKYNAAAAAICIVGVGFISLDSNLGIGFGDLLTIICGIFFAVHIVVTSHVVESHDPVLLAMLQFASAGIAALACALIFEHAPVGMQAADIISLIYLTFIATTGCLLMQVFGQKYTPPSQAAVIMTLESVFGAIASVVIYREVLTVQLVTGFALTFIAVVISETKLSFLFRKS